MKVRDVLECGIIRDTDTVRIRTEFLGSVQQIAAGKWFEDRILNELDSDVFEFKWSKFRGAVITSDRRQS